LTAVPVLLAETRAAGAEVAIDSGVLRIRVPRGALTDGQREWLAQHRAEIAALLAPAVSPVTYLQPPLEDAAPRPPPAEPMIEDITRLQRIAGSAGRLGGLSARLDYARPPHRWGDFTDALRERDWRARMDALREERAAISSFDGGLGWMEVTGKSEGATP
jgi:TubC N-terminal docking domain